ncbi:MAG: VOC family protein [Proteobacteria bacterium]|nr:VOC family protein [Pseudomonadota bacterium]
MAAPAPKELAPAKPVPTNFVEFKVRDVARAKTFYGAIFGWSFDDYGPNYASFMSNGMGGGFAANAGAPTPGGPLMVFHVDHLADTLARAKAAGADIVKPIFSFPGGKRFEFRDPDGYLVAAWTQE